MLLDVKVEILKGLLEREAVLFSAFSSTKFLVAKVLVVEDNAASSLKVIHIVVQIITTNWQMARYFDFLANSSIINKTKTVSELKYSHSQVTYDVV